MENTNVYRAFTDPAGGPASIVIIAVIVVFVVFLFKYVIYRGPPKD